MRTLFEHFETQYYIEHQNTIENKIHFTYVSISRLSCRLVILSNEGSISLPLLTNTVRTSLAPLRRIFNVDLTTFSQMNPEYLVFVVWRGVAGCGVAE
jgi:hypothetical protein